MKRIFKSVFRILLFVVLLGGIASMFPVTTEIFQHLPLWVIYPMRICASMLLVFMIIGYVIDCGLLQRVFRKK